MVVPLKIKSSKELKRKLKQMFLQVLPGFIGLLKKIEACFQVCENAVPVFKSHRKVPFAANEIVNEELNRQEKIGLIKKVNYSKCVL